MQVFEKRTILAGAPASGHCIELKSDIRKKIHEMDIINKFREGMA